MTLYVVAVSFADALSKVIKMDFTHNKNQALKDLPMYQASDPKIACKLFRVEFTEEEVKVNEPVSTSNK